MKKYFRLCVSLTGLAVLSALNACATGIKSKASVCQVRFDYQDRALEQLNTQNLRALLTFRALCRP